MWPSFGIRGRLRPVCRKPNAIYYTRYYCSLVVVALRAQKDQLYNRKRKIRVDVRGASVLVETILDGKL